MKQVQFRRAAQSSGFRPIQVSGAEISRMREESNRIIQGMRDVRDAEIRNRTEILQETKESQRAEAASRERNFQVQQQNQQRELSGLQAEARAKQQQFEADQRAQAEIFKSVANFSEAAGKAYAQYVEAKDQQDFEEGFQEFREDPTKNKYFASLVGEKFQDEEEEKRQLALDTAQANGADPLGVAKQRNYNNRVQRELYKAIFAYAAKNKFPQLRKEFLQQKEEEKGSALTSEERAAFTAQITSDFYNKGAEFNGIRLKPGTLRTTLDAIDSSNQSFLSRARDADLKTERQLSIDNETKIISQNPDEFETNIIPSFQAIARATGDEFGNKNYAAALDWLGQRFLEQKSDGSFILDLTKLATLQLPGDKKPFAQARPGRFAEIERARLDADNKYRRTQITADNIAYQEAEKNYLQGFTENPTKAYAEEGRDMFISTYGRVPASVEKTLASYTIEAQAKAEQIEQLESIPDGFITQEAVNALSYLDLNASRELGRRYAAQEAKYNSGVYKEQSDSFKTIANGITKIGSQGPNRPASVFLQQEMRAEYRKRVDQAVAGGADFTTAANTIAIALGKEVEAGSLVQSSLWYRKVSKAGGAADFPNLNGDNVTAVEKARRNYQSIVNSIIENGGGAKGLEKTLDTAESVLTREEIASIVSGYGKPGFVVPTDVLAVSGMGNGLDPFTIINRQIAALGDPNVLPLEPPAIIQSVNSTMTEQQRQDLFNAVNGPMQRLRALQQTAGTVAQPSNLRAGFAGNNLKRSFTDALTYEGNRGAYQQTGQTLQKLGFQVAEHPDFGGVAPVHAGNSFHGYGEAFDITHQTGDYDTSIERTRQLKELIRSMNLFKEVIGPGDGDPAHATHLHLGGLMRPLTAEDIEKLNSFK